jgi:hypothetical protein
MGENYNDGKWHGWNGGPCPVHQQSIVETVWRFKDGDIREAKDIGRAGSMAFFGNEHGELIAFRVVKEHREPREWWLTMCGRYTHAHTSLSAADVYCEHNSDVTTIHVREVL